MLTTYRPSLKQSSLSQKRYIIMGDESIMGLHMLGNILQWQLLFNLFDQYDLKQ